jgi:hypothetical protein
MAVASHFLSVAVLLTRFVVAVVASSPRRKNDATRSAPFLEVVDEFSQVGSK